MRRVEVSRSVVVLREMGAAQPLTFGEEEGRLTS